MTKNATARRSTDAVKPTARKAARRGRPRKFTREQLVDSAIELIDEQGYQSLSLRALARQAGLFPSTLYTYFEDFDDLTRAVTERLHPHGLIAKQASTTTPRRQLVDFLMEARGAMLRHPETMSAPIGSGGWQLEVEAMEHLLELLADLPQGPGSTLLGLDALIGAVSYSAQRERQHGDASYRADFSKALDALPPEEGSRLRAAVRELSPDRDPREIVEGWLDLLIDRLLPGIDELPEVAVKAPHVEPS